MKKNLLLVIILIITACNKKEADLTVKVNIEGLKKGTLFLKKIEDTTLVSVDSVTVNGVSQVELYSDLDSPEVFYLYLDKNSAEKDRITFFADKGVTEINTVLKNFSFEAQIKGSKQQKVLEEYRKVISKINNRSLDLIKDQFEAQKNGDTVIFDSLVKQKNNTLKRKYLYTVNFALNNKDSEVAPYLALSEIYDARIDLLDTINKSLTPNVKNSKYGKQLERFIQNVRQKENQ
jgi:succinate dehydrogenase flavin-adding protein (antitoxin of CptAB toxin-antitoxin module)